MTVTVLELKQRARYRANMENSTFVTDTELLTYLNASIAELYDILISKNGEDYFASSTDLTLTSGTDAYNLPSDFYKLLGIDLQIDAYNWIRLRRFNYSERKDEYYHRYTNINDVKYRIRANQVIFEPITSLSGKTVRAWYVPLTTKVSSDASTVDNFNGWEEYIIIKTAIKMLQKEESDTSALYAELQLITQRIEAMADNRDQESPGRVRDIDKINFWE